MDYKHCPKCEAEMTIKPNGHSTSDGLECLACGHFISVYEMSEAYRVSLRAASNNMIEIELTKARYAKLLAESLVEHEQRRDIELANLFNPALEEELELLREITRREIDEGRNK